MIDAVAKIKESRGTRPARRPVRRKLLPRAQRREQILTAATRAFARSGFAATSLDEVAAEAKVDRVILYRHFESKADLYRAVLARARARLAAASGTPNYTETSLAGLLAGAADEPAAFRLLFRQAGREPEFRAEMEDFRRRMSQEAQRAMAGMIPDKAWDRWASILVPTVAVEAVLAWLDAGQPDAAAAAQRIEQAVFGVIQAARSGPADWHIAAPRRSERR